MKKILIIFSCLSTLCGIVFHPIPPTLGQNNPTPTATLTKASKTELTPTKLSATIVTVLNAEETDKIAEAVEPAPLELRAEKTVRALPREIKEAGSPQLTGPVKVFFEQSLYNRLEKSYKEAEQRSFDSDVRQTFRNTEAWPPAENIGLIRKWPPWPSVAPVMSDPNDADTFIYGSSSDNSARGYSGLFAGGSTHRHLPIHYRFLLVKRSEPDTILVCGFSFFDETSTQRAECYHRQAVAPAF